MSISEYEREFAEKIARQPRVMTITLPPAQVATDIYDQNAVTTTPSGWCSAGCKAPIQDGEHVRSIQPGLWMHEACALKHITDSDTNEAWLILADAVARRPSAFKASDIRAVMQNIAHIARNGGV